MELVYWELEQKNIVIELVHCNFEVVVLIRSGLGKNWVQFSLANDLLLASQLV